MTTSLAFSGRDNLPEFLATAKELEVKGLMGGFVKYVGGWVGL